MTTIKRGPEPEQGEARSDEESRNEHRVTTIKRGPEPEQGEARSDEESRNEHRVTTIKRGPEPEQGEASSDEESRDEHRAPSPPAATLGPAQDNGAAEFPVLHDPGARGFASDNYAGVHPEVLSALAAVNGGHQIAYGDDVYTQRLQQVIRRHFGERVETFPVFNGTGANVVSLQSMLPRWGAVICAESAHINTDENGAPERVAGIKLLTVATPDGKLTPELIDRQAWGFGDEHRAQPMAVSITQSTELGTIYTPSEIAAICEHAHRLGAYVHVDGSRIANAAAAANVSLAAMTSDAGVDVLSFGGTKNGLLAGEAVVVLNPEACAGLKYLRKLDMQLASKMRFFSAQLIALLDGDLWLRSARHANAMAQRLSAGVRGLPQVRITREVQANAVFAILPRDVADRVRQRFRFYDWAVATGEVRWMCAWDTTEADVDAFVDLLRNELPER